MSTKYSKIYVKSGTIEITIEGNDQFVSEQYREIFSNQSNQNTSTDKEDRFAPGKSNELSDAQKVSASSYEEMKGQTKKAKTTKSSAKSAKSSTKTTKSTQSAKPGNSNKLLNALGSDFGKWLAHLPENVETRDKILLAAYYNQRTNPDQKFYVWRIRTLLNEHGISIPHLSSFVDTFEIQKIISKVADSSRKGYQFTKEGEKYIEDIFASQINK